MNTIKMGDKCKDKITGYVGTVTAKAEYLHSTTRYQLERDGDGEILWFDEPRIEVIT